MSRQGHKCFRCGLCCLTVGRTFWKNGDFENNAELNEPANNGDYEDGGLPCEMLEMKNGRATCLIQSRYGRQYKPAVCRDYPEDGEPCELENEIKREIHEQN